MVSIYSSAFNLLKNKFDYRDALENFYKIGDEIVIAVNTSDDGTLDELINLQGENDKLRVIATDYSYDDPWLDGKIKEAALQETRHEVKLGLDLDERVPIWQKESWISWAEALKGNGPYQSLLIPSVNLYGDERHYFSIGQKWYLHRSGLHRGPVNFARNVDGTVDIERSDTCELIDEYGNLTNSLRLSVTDLFVYHLGYMNIEDRVLRNKNFWRKHWSVESGKEVDIPIDVLGVEKDKVKKRHYFKLWYET